MSDNKKEEKKENKKLSYDELAAYSAQVVERAKKIMEENNTLKQYNQELRIQLNAREIDWAFKVLEYKDLFAKEFVGKVVAKLTEIMTPQETPAEEDNKEE